MLPMQIRPTIWVGLDEATRRSILALEIWDLEYLAERSLRRGNASNRVETLIAEYRRFVALSLLERGSTHVMVGPVDDVWHDHILHTCDYAAFCQSILGRFLHHTPDAEGGVLKDRDQLTTITLLGRYFVHFSRETWLEPASGFCDSRDFSFAGTGGAPALVH